MQARKLSIPWQDVDTVLLDMDGTLLDLAFDNFFWLELVPAQYARLHGFDEGEARHRIRQRYEGVVGTLAWYCLDHWSRELGLDIAALKWNHRHLISYLPGAIDFLSDLRQRGKAASIVTNAHPGTISVKTRQTSLHTRVDRVFCSHRFEVPKESREFWTALQRRQSFDPERTLLVEDSPAVLAAARDYGIRHIVAIRRPDSTLPARDVDGFRSVDGVVDLIPEDSGRAA